MRDEDLVILALAVISRDLELVRRIVELANNGVIEEGELQETLKLSVTNLRVMLYQMQDFNLVIQLGAKEDGNGGYLSYWRINKDVAKSFLLRRLKYTKSELMKRKEEDLSGEYYVCAADPSHARLSFDEMIRSMGEGSPTCPVCGAMMEPVNKEEVVKLVDSMIELIDRAIETLEG
jgi:transcription factor E